jgi:hypothetical protein
MSVPLVVPRKEKWLAAALLFVLLAAVHYDVVFLGRSLVLTNHYNPLDYRPLAQNYGEDLVPADVWSSRNLYSYANIRDAGGPWWQWEPDGEFLRRAMEVGEWPFWDPYVGAGTPAMANMTPGYFFPPYTALVALGASVPLKNAYFLLQLWCAGFFTVLFLRLHGLSFVSTLFGGIVVVMSGGLNQHIGTIALQTAACLPIVLYVTRRFLDAPTGWRTVTLAVVYASTALACFPPILMWLFGIAAMYALLAILLDDRGIGGPARMPLLLHWGAATALSVGLVAFFYVPALTLRASVPYVVMFYEGAGVESLPLVKALQLLSPTLMGGVLIYVNSAVPTNHTPNLPYVGIVALIAALLAIPSANPRARVVFYTSALGAVLILMKLFGIPPVQWIARLPLFDQIHYAYYFGISLSFLIAFLAALGLDALVRGATGPGRALVAVALSLAATESLWWFVREFDVLKSPADGYWIRDWRVLNGLTMLSAFALMAGTLRDSLRPAAVTALVLLVSAEGIFNNTYPSPDSWDIFDHPVPYVQVLQREAGMKRVLPFGALNANLNSGFEIFSLDSLMTINPPRAYELYRRYTDPPPWLFLREARRIPPEPVLDRANIGFLAIREAFPALVKEAQARGYTVRFNDGYVWLFERPTLPRFLFSSEYRVLRAPSALNAMGQGPSREILLERPAGFPSTPNGAGDPDVRVEAYHRNSVALTVDAPRPGLVYAAESYFDGWTVRVNGKPVTILPANYAFRAVEVAAGQSRIEFRYWPPGLTLGLIVSGLSAALLAAFAVVLGRRAAAGSVQA